MNVQELKIYWNKSSPEMHHVSFDHNSAKKKKAQQHDNNKLRLSTVNKRGQRKPAECPFIVNTTF